MTDNQREALELHAQWQGKMATVPKVKIDSKELLALAYTPGVAKPCLEIKDHPEEVYSYTGKANTIAIVTDGTAVLGLGNIGPEAALPVMEGKAMLFKQFGGVNAVPICLNTQDPDEIVETVVRIAPAFGGINLEDIAATHCFEVERRLNELLPIPVFHDDQHGTAICVLAALINALRLTHKSEKDVRVVINGAGSAGVAIGKLLYSYGFNNIVFCGRNGILHSEYRGIYDIQKELLTFANPENLRGSLADALCGADVFIGVSAGGVVSREMVSQMNKDAIVFAMANPVPEIYPEEAFAGGARVVGTGRSDYPNQINNLLAFPGIFRGALEARAECITLEMKLASAQAIAALVSDEELTEDYIIPDVFDKRLAPTVARAVKDCEAREAATRSVTNGVMGNNLCEEAQDKVLERISEKPGEKVSHRINRGFYEKSSNKSSAESSEGHRETLSEESSVKPGEVVETADRSAVWVDYSATQTASPKPSNSSNSQTSGLLITFEGGEGAGKSTHIAFLSFALRLRGYEVVCLREPGYTRLGEKLREVLLDPENTHISPETELLLYEASRAQLMEECIKPALKRSAVVLCDRFIDSTLAYQAYGRGLDEEAVQSANAFACSGIIPDRTIVLQAGVSVRESLHRATKDLGADRIELAGEDFHQRVNEAFACLADKDPKRIRTVASSGTKVETSRALFGELKDLLPCLDDYLRDESFFEPLMLPREERFAYYERCLNNCSHKSLNKA